MKPPLCPTCNQIIPPPIGPFDHSPVKQRIFDFIARHPEGVTMPQLMDHVYALDPAGGPENPNVISAHLHGMRRTLAKTGITVSKTGGHGTKYRLVQATCSPSAG